jgi:two-component system, NtrC family, response regulator
MTAEWRGNVRELRNVLERACMLAEPGTLSERDVAVAMPSPADASQADGVEDEDSDDLGAVEREHIIRVLAELRGNKVAAARRLGISRRTLYRRLERHGLTKH